MKLLTYLLLTTLITAGTLATVPGANLNPVAPGAVSASVGGNKIAPGAALNGPSASSMLNSLQVKGKAPTTGYDRNAKFGNGWKDFDGDKCDERQDTLTRDMSKVKYKDNKHCQLASGTLHDAYTGTVINWKVNTGSVDIDHVVALRNVWVSGGQQMSQDQRVAVANDPLNLMASQASANRSKGDANASEWLPSNKQFRCQYVATQISVKSKYALAVTAAEKAAMQGVLKSCPTQKGAKVAQVGGPGKLPAALPAAKPPVTVKTSAAPAAKPKQISPGAYCAKEDAGLKGIGKKNGNTYTCKSGGTDERLRWR